MIPYKKILIETDTGSNELLTRLNWQTNHTDYYLFAKTNTFTSTSKKPLIGKTDGKRQSFTLTRLRPFIEMYLPQYFIKGQILDTNNGVVIHLKFMPGLFTGVLLIYLTVAVGFLLWQAGNSIEDKELLFNNFIWIMVIISSTILISIRELGKISGTILDIINRKK